MKIALFPGSFDPVHNGHIALALHAAEVLKLDKVIFVPSGISPNKRFKQRTPGTTRHAWLQKALTDQPKLEVSDYESKHTVPTYTMETIAHFKNEVLPKDTDLFLLMGTDTVKRMERWPTHKKILEMATVVSFGRAGEKGNITAPEWPHSSTEIRENLAAGKSIDHLVPAAIKDDVHATFKPKTGPDLDIS